MKIGYALFSARDVYNDPQSLERVLREVSRMGYDGVEFFHYAGMPPKELSGILKDTGLEAPSAHVQVERWQADYDSEIDYAKQAGIGSLTFPWLAPEYRTPEVFTELAQGLPILAEKCAKQGIGLQYHSHDFEFMRIGEAYIMDMLLQGKGFQYEIDTFWADYAGVDPVEYMRAHSDRIDMIHVKDYTTLTPQNVYCPIGTGKMDNERVLNEAKRQGKAWAFVELDDCPMDPLEAARISLDNIHKMIGK